jgi:protein TonB
MEMRLVNVCHNMDGTPCGKLWMVKLMRRLKQEQLFSLLFVLALHAAVLYGLWSYRIIPAPVQSRILAVTLVDPPSQQRPLLPEPAPPGSAKPGPVELPGARLLPVQAPATLSKEPVVPAPSAPSASPPAVIVAPPLPQQPEMLPSELSASCPERKPPEYPFLSMRLNEQGKVVLRVELAGDGRVASAEVMASSGHQRLDQAALEAVKTWRCKPATRDGQAVRAVALQPFKFVLNE